MLMDFERNNFVISDDSKEMMLKATLNFEKVSEGESEDMGILPIFTIFAIGNVANVDKVTELTEMYAEMLVVLSSLFPDVYYIDTYRDDDATIFCMKETTIVDQQNQAVQTKVPMKTELKIHRA